MAKQKEKFKTWGGVFDQFTERLLFEIGSKGLFDEIESPIFVGKESNVFSAKKGDGRVIIKIYRLETCDFNRMYDYIKYDNRYLNLRKHKRKVIFAWAQREFRNLMIAREAGARVPTPLFRESQVLILEYIGDEHGIAPRVKDSLPDDPKAFFDDLIVQIKKMYKANLVHGDLSQFNVLNLHEKPVIIDFSQSTTRENPRADEYLKRDIKNLCTFFKKLGVEYSEEQVYAQVTKKKP